MSRGKIEVVEGPKPPKKATETLEQTIERAAATYLAEVGGRVDRVVEQTIGNGFDELVFKHLGIERDRWSGDYRWNYSGYRSAFADELKQRIDEAARRIIDGIDFETITLTTAQANAIKTAYQRQLKDQLVNAARDLADQDARTVVAQILGTDRVAEDLEE